jgi:hypothetical protein
VVGGRVVVVAGGLVVVVAGALVVDVVAGACVEVVLGGAPVGTAATRTGGVVVLVDSGASMKGTVSTRG